MEIQTETLPTIHFLMTLCYNNGMTMTMTKAAPLSIANTFIDKYGRENGIQHMKLQKLVYFAHGWWLAYNDEPFLTERPQVWRYGPVFKSLYSSLAQFGKTPIKEPQKSTPFSPAMTVTDPNLLELIEFIWDKYSPYSAIKLSDMTHEKGTPWRIIAEEKEFSVPENFEIPDELIKKYFKSQAELVQTVQTA